MKKIQDKEMVKVLTIMAEAAQKVLKKVRKKEMQPAAEAEQLVNDLKAKHQGCSAAK